MIKKYLKKIFKILNPGKELAKIHNKYKEKDTRCDLCKHESKEDCYLIEITTRDDTRRHFINGIGFVCPLRRMVEEHVKKRDLYLEREKVLNMNE